ncbi:MULTISPECIES: terminase [unclassified Rhodococcus (in: high G+C Gram-positive bacteria)]|uniref:terminase n=1 Tax=unclassified Rhodococcus (in: high G+C Gram-positive bacteria) TaxID=192944 RepID=UPI001639BAD7|nr:MULTISPECIES: terminase [unclassified Rhodococcus (in: high G+C Gram-positive bacteria)]MBC2639662.1 terminase [Rhodococcus sp. 3A]MBC2895593.1 terminase [Rhodococcus sp. 4CII]
MAGQRTVYPETFGEGGKAMWREVTSTYALSSTELALLKQLCRTIDRLDVLELAAKGVAPVFEARQGTVMHPVFVEIRQQSTVMARLIASLRLPDAPTIAAPKVDDAPKRPQRRSGSRPYYGVNNPDLKVVGHG